jgi:hypothetical protein
MQFDQVVQKVSNLDWQRPLLVAGPGGAYQVIDVREHDGAIWLEIVQVEVIHAKAKAGVRQRRGVARHADSG